MIFKKLKHVSPEAGVETQGDFGGWTQKGELAKGVGGPGCRDRENARGRHENTQEAVLPP